MKEKVCMVDWSRIRFGQKSLPGVALLIMALLPWSAFAADTIVTPFVGYRSGGDVEEVATGKEVDIDEGDAQGLIIGWEMGAGVFEIIYSYQASELTGSSSVSPAVLVDVDVSQLLGSGRVFLDRDLGTYVGFMLGFTHIDFDGSGFDADTRPSLGFEGGIDYPLSEGLGLRAGVRGVFTVVDTDDDVYCTSSTDCPIESNDNLLEQWELFTGLSFRF